MIKKEKQKMNNDMKIFIGFSITIALALSLLFYSMLKPKAVVMINGNKVNTTEFQFYYAQNLSEALQSKDTSMNVDTFLKSSTGTGTVKDSIKQQVLSQIVQIKVLLLKAKKDEIKISRKEINEEWQVFEDNLKISSKNSQMSYSEYSKAAFGVSLSKAEKYYKEYIKSQKYMTAKTEEVAVDKKELSTFYDENKPNLDRAEIRHILVTCAEDAKDNVVAEKKKLAESILEKVKKGDDFAALAKEYSEDPGSKDNGGMYEIQPNGQMVAEFEDWTFSHKVNDTGIVRTSFGFHIMKLDSIFNTLESQSKEIESAYKSYKYQSELEEAMSGNQYKIEVLEAYSLF